MSIETACAVSLLLCVVVSMLLVVHCIADEWMERRHRRRMELLNQRAQEPRLRSVRGGRE